MDNKRRNVDPCKRERILKENNYLCAYCDDVASVVDHIIPASYRRDNREDNLAASCQICNNMAGNKVFNDFSEKQEWIRDKRERLFKKKIIVLWLKDDFEELGFLLQNEITKNTLIIDTMEIMFHVKCQLEEEGFKVKTSLD